MIRQLVVTPLLALVIMSFNKLHWPIPLVCTVERINPWYIGYKYCTSFATRTNKMIQWATTTAKYSLMLMCCHGPFIIKDWRCIFFSITEWKKWKHGSVTLLGLEWKIRLLLYQFTSLTKTLLSKPYTLPTGGNARDFVSDCVKRGCSTLYLGQKNARRVPTYVWSCKLCNTINTRTQRRCLKSLHWNSPY